MLWTILSLTLVAVSGLACDPFAIATNYVVITDALQFTPDTLTVEHGTTVVWKNESSQYHLLQSDSLVPDGISEMRLAPVGGEDQTYPAAQSQAIMGTPGVFPYHSTLHSQEHGVLIVR